MNLRNSLSLPAEEVERLLSEGHPHTIRIKVPEDETVSFQDMIRGMVTFETNLVDDKVLLKADGMPTYHLAVIVDDKSMEISHVFRGEEWLPSAPVHILLWEYLGWKDQMPEWAHLPLILKPDGNGKLSKRDGDRLGFPVYAMNWTDPKSGDLTTGFRELGFLPEAFINMLAVLGWNDGTEQELFSLEELINKFSVDRISKSGAKFDYEKAKWYNHEWIKSMDNGLLLPQIGNILQEQGVHVDLGFADTVLTVIKERLTFLSDFWPQASFFFVRPAEYDLAAVQSKWNADKTAFFEQIIHDFEHQSDWTAAALEPFFKGKVTESGMKIGELMLPFRIMLVGGKFGPDVFLITELLGKEEVIARIRKALPLLG
jgi:glutamyl-tRNA synthetase